MWGRDSAVEGLAAKDQIKTQKPLYQQCSNIERFGASKISRI